MNKLRVLLLVLTALFTVFSSAQQAAPNKSHDCHSGKYRFEGTVFAGQTFAHDFDGFFFALEPSEYGWMIDISRGEQHYLANMTGPRHFVPSPIEIEGWHFRSAANTAGNIGDVNAPQRTRRFLFSPRWPQCPHVAGLEKDGQGTLLITDVQLGNLAEGEKATIVKMKFTVVLSVGRSSCTACPLQQR